MPEHATAPRPLRARLERTGDTGHLLRGVGYVSNCVCGWHSGRCETWSMALEEGREHIREHEPASVGATIPPPGTVPPPVSGEASHPTRERES